MTPKIIASLVAIATVAAVAGGATVAYFSDTETSTGNTFASGTLDLKLDNGDSNVAKFTVDKANPSEKGTGTWQLNNVANLDGYVDLASISVVNAEMGCGSDSEKDVDSNCATETTEGELAANLDVVLFWDDGNGGGTANNGIQEGAEKTIYSGKLSGIGASYDEDYKLVKTSGVTYVTMNWSVAETVGNLIQSDKVTLGMNFDLDQTND